MAERTHTHIVLFRKPPRAGLTPRQIALVATVFWFTSIGAGLLWLWFRYGRNV